MATPAPAPLSHVPRTGEWDGVGGKLPTVLGALVLLRRLLPILGGGGGWSARPVEAGGRVGCGRAGDDMEWEPSAGLVCAIELLIHRRKKNRRGGKEKRKKRSHMSGLYVCQEQAAEGGKEIKKK